MRMAKRKPLRKKIVSGLKKLVGYKRPMRPKEKVDLLPNEFSKKDAALEDILDNFDSEQSERIERWRRDKRERAKDSERRRRKKAEEQ